MLKLKKSLSRHDAILLHLAAFRRNTDLYFFSRYTPLRDLEIFLQDGWHDETEIYDFNRTFPNYEPLDLFGQMYAIAGAFEVLHRDLQVSGEEGDFASHMDVKPQNILVFPCEIGVQSTVGSWKLTDFGLADFTGGQDNRSGSNVPPVNRQGPHYPPEWDYRLKKRYPASGRSSDMWSFGCIFAEVLTYAVGGKELLEEFRASRLENSDDDVFFELAASSDSEIKSLDLKPSLQAFRRKPSVDRWLSALQERSPLAALYREVLEKTIVIEPAERWEAGRVVSELSKLNKISRPPTKEGEPAASIPLHQPKRDDKDGLLQQQDRNDPQYTASSKLNDWALSPTGEFAVYLDRTGRGSFFCRTLNLANNQIFKASLPNGVKWAEIHVAGAYVTIKGTREDTRSTPEVIPSHILPPQCIL